MATSTSVEPGENKDQPQGQPENQEQRAKHGNLKLLFITLGVATIVGIVAAVLVAASSPGGDSVDGARWSIYMLATALVAAIAGLVFGVPRARADFAPEATERYEANSNLEQISDWLTKLLVGAGLVELTNVPGGLRSLGEFLGEDMSLPNPAAFAASAVVYGAGLGFATGYLWTRLRFRVLLERSDREAAEESQRDKIVRTLSQAAPPGGPSEDPAALRQAADSALTIVRTTKGAPRLPILWVDDHPENNTSIVRALQGLGIRVDTVPTTQAALAQLERDTYGLVISDLGRFEDGEEHPMAGRELLEALPGKGIRTPVIIFGGPRAKQHEDELLAAGASVVSQRASQVFEEAVRHATGS